ncbi:MAG: hypothetical protein ACRD3J_25530, partial [Thermoanaerobaculia bacterium]
MPIATAIVRALVPIRPEDGGELLRQRHLDRLPNVSPKLRFDVLPELKNRGGACASLLHGVPPSPLLTAICFGQQEVTPFCFFHKTRDTSREAATVSLLVAVGEIGGQGLLIL